MNAEPKAPPRLWEITIESDWLTTLGSAALLVACALLLVREIDAFIWGHLAGQVRLHRSFWSMWDSIFEAIAAIYCLLFAFKFPKKLVRLACALMGINLAGLLLLGWLPVTAGVRHVAAISGSVMRQIALVLLCVASAQWLKSVVHWGPPQKTQGDNG